jgi:hypothetical protein
MSEMIPNNPLKIMDTLLELGTVLVASGRFLLLDVFLYVPGSRLLHGT